MTSVTNSINAKVIANAVLATNGSDVQAYTQSLPAAVQVGVNSLNSGTSASSSTFWRGDGTWATSSGGTGTGATTLLNYNSNTQSINSSANVTSVTYSSTGKYIINFTANYANINYVTMLTVSNDLAAGTYIIGSIDSYTAAPTTSTVHVINYAAAANNAAYSCAAIFPL